MSTRACHRLPSIVAVLPAPLRPRPAPAADLLPKIIMGVDPGTQIMGYALIEVRGQRVDVLCYDVINMKALGSNHAVKLKRIFDRMLELIDEYLPDELAIEAPFFGVNVQSMLKLGRAQGVAIAAAINSGVPVTEYSPKKVKQSITGNGNAGKEQIFRMLQNIVALPDKPQYFDATDALAVAICHYYQGRVPVPVASKPAAMRKRKEGWETFLKTHSHRVVG